MKKDFSLQKKIAIITDAWEPQINGVVTTLKKTIECLKENHGFEVLVIHPYLWKTKPFWAYKHADVPIQVGHRLDEMLNQFNPDYIHIAVEGVLGRRARRYCHQKKYAYSTAYHTRFPEYAKEQRRIPLSLSYFIIRWFHAHSSSIMAPTHSLIQHLRSKKLSKLALWERGVDIEKFHPKFSKHQIHHKPYALYVGRVSVEKNIDAFLETSTPGLDKIVIGDGPQLAELQKKYKSVLFFGFKKEEELAAFYANAAIFVFPSLTDTFGLTVIEALACGTPIAAFPVTGPLDILSKNNPSHDLKKTIHTEVGALSWNLEEAISLAQTCSREKCRQFAAEHYQWTHCTQQFVDNLPPISNLKK